MERRLNIKTSVTINDKDINYVIGDIINNCQYAIVDIKRTTDLLDNESDKVETLRNLVTRLENNFCQILSIVDYAN